jgi:TPR repeat protein
MTTLRGLMLVAALSLAPALHAQSCSGGPDGGADATGNQCNATGISSDARDPALGLRDQGLVDYERGNYDAAVKWFRRAADQGDVRSAVMIVLMHRHNLQLYGGRVPVSDDEARKWADVIARAAQAQLAGDARLPR